MRALTPKMKENIKNSYDYRCGLAILLITAQEITKKRPLQFGEAKPK